MMQLPWLNPNTLEFPPLDSALTDPDGLLAAGGDLCPERLIRAYSQGIFPWYEDRQPILWWSPNPRSVLHPGDIHISRSLAKTLRQTSLQVTCDSAFAEVIRQCAAPRDGQGTWITEQMSEAYLQLHRLGVAHSVEVWDGKTLAGGLYGIALGRVFFGESMFTRQANASKIGFVTLAQHLQQWGFELIDCQVTSNHLSSFGAVEMARAEFAEALQQLTVANGQSLWPHHQTQLTPPKRQTNSSHCSRVPSTAANEISIKVDAP